MKTDKEEKHRTFSNKFFYCALLSLFLIWCFVVSRWSYDEIHEGQVLLSVKAISNDLFIHRDFFEYKGLLFPYVIETLLLADLPLVLNVRLLTTLIIFATAILTFVFLNRTVSAWAKVLPLAWLLISPPIMLWSSRPWPYKVLIDPNVLSVFLFLLVILLVTSEQNYIKKKSDIQPRLISAGLLLGLLPWNRVQNMFFVLLILLLVIKHKDFSHKSKAIFSSLCIITLLIPLLFLLHNNALNSWWEQIILTPRKLLQTQDTMVAMSFQQFMTTLIKFVIFSFVLTILLFVYSRLNKVTRERSLKFLVDALVLLTMTFLGIFSISRDVNPNLDNALSNWIIIVGQWLPFSIWHLVVILTIIICVYIFLTIPLKIIRNQLRSSEFQLSFELQVLMATSISCIIFLYPNVGNLWAVSLPIGIFVIRYFEHLGFSIFTQRAVRTRYDFFEKSLQRILCMTSISGLLLLPFANSNMNLDFKNPDLKFLKTNNSRSVDVNDALFQLGSRIVDGAGSVYFHCPYGLASMPGDEYLPNSENWGDIVYTIPNRKNELVFARYLVVCWDSYEVKSFSIPSSFVKIDDVVKNGSKIASLYSQSK